MSSRGITFIELVVAIALVTMLTWLGFALLKEGNTKRDIDRAQNTIRTVFEDARARTLAADGGQQHGVYIASTTLTVFQGSTYDELGQENSIIALPQRVYIGTTTLSGEDNTVIFERLTGYTMSTGTIEIAHEIAPQASSTLVIEETGIIFFE